MAHAVADGGFRLIEITWNSDRPEVLISLLRKQLPSCLIGAGTILDSLHLRGAVSAGAQFLFSPHFNQNLWELALNRYEIPLIPGALSPTEIVTAWQAGAKTVKIFPINIMGGASYIRSLQGPLAQVSLIPTGGVTVDNARELIDAGAIAVGLSGNLFLTTLVSQQNWQGITQRAKMLLDSIHIT
jgi:2-dehydro-3-deoxyphosphogluconate aldolase/(4S)-4-hydroxy-2-oxoglutarate aldolase